ncbi:hypothetical protein KEM54_001062, partial [Ascosphaera aggregata]
MNKITSNGRSTPDSAPSSPLSTPRTSVCSCSDSESEPVAADGVEEDVIDDDIPFLDVLIIGAGPSGLAVAARIREETPSAMFTDDEHQRYHWIKKHTGKMKIVQARRKIRGVNSEKYISPSCCKDSIGGNGGEGEEFKRKTKLKMKDEHMVNADKSILVLDSSGKQWLSRWNRLFNTYEISHLRSPMFFHVDPMDRDGMLAYARETGREKELWELHGCVGQEMSKHRKKKKMMMKHARSQHRPREVEIDERDRKDYWCPSSSLFSDYCNSIVERYDLDANTMVRQAEVTDLTYSIVPGSGLPDTKIFTVRTADKRTFYAKAVVVAVGPGLKKHLPWELTPDEMLGSVHSFEIEEGRFLPSHIREKIKKGIQTDVVVIGGGLTSSQVVDNLVKKGVTRVWYIMRSPLKVKHFDMSLKWVGKFRNYEKAIFWSADTVEEKLEMYNEARQGGSINPKIHKDIKKHITSGRVKLCTHTQVTSHSFDKQSMSWTLETDNPIEGFPHDQIDYIYFATGMNARLDEMDFLKTMLRTYPAPMTPCGFPHLTTDLEYFPGVPLFFTGRLAALHLGPGAPNLEGARLGAERVAWALEGVWEKEKERERERGRERERARRASQKKDDRGGGGGGGEGEEGEEGKKEEEKEYDDEKDKEEMRRMGEEESILAKTEKALYAFSGMGNRYGAFDLLE